MTLVPLRPARPVRSLGRRARFAAAGVALVASSGLACERTLDLGVDERADASGAEDAPSGLPGQPRLDGAPSDGTVDDGPGGEGDGGRDAQPGADAGTGYVFVTRGTYPGDLGGVAGADFRCQSSATAAGLEGVYRAWISDATVNAADRISWPGPWREVGSGDVLFPDRSALRGFPLAPLARDETGQVAPARWWTGTAINGLKHEKTCSGWTSRSSGQGGMTGIRKTGADGGRPGKEWTEDVAYSCVFDNDLQRYALVCFRDG